LAEDRVVRSDDEIRTDRHLAATTVRHPVDGGDDRPAQLAQRKEKAIEDLTLAQPLFLRHLLALVQVAADRKGTVTRPGDDRDAHRGASRNRFQHFGQCCRQFGRDRVVGVRPVQGNERHAPAGNVLDEHELVRLGYVQRRSVAKPRHSRSFPGGRESSL